MKTMNKKITGIAAAVSLLTVMAGSVYAADVCCTAGTVTEAGSVFQTTFFVATSHRATLTCDIDIGFGTTADTPPAGRRTFELVGTTKDAMLATALTALADDKKVGYCLMNVNAPTVAPAGNVNGHVRSIYVTNIPL